MGSSCNLDALKNFSVILVRPLYAGNVGSVARAMMNMGLSRLKLVKPCRTDLPECRRMAGKAIELVEHAEVFPSLESALESERIVVATTSARGREMEQQIFSPRQIAPRLLDFARTQSVGLVFGSERSGLTTSQLAKGQFLVSLPAAEIHPVLNLSQSVLLLAYELFTAKPSGEEMEADLADQRDREAMFEHVQQVLTETGFLSSGSPAPVMNTLRRLLDDPLLNRRDIQIIRGIMSHMEWFAKQGHLLGGSVIKP